MVRYGMVIELSRCTGCLACTHACKVENNTPAGIFWMSVFKTEEGKYPHVNIRYMPRPCMHCDNAPCVKVCPVEARYKREDGLVLTDFNRCIGCRYCQVSCPYGVNYFNWKPPRKNYYFDYEGGEGANVYGTGNVGNQIGETIPPYENPDHAKLHGAEKRLNSGGGHFVGVIEKCTFCVHRIEEGLKPACVANCPMNVLHFGDLDDSESEVSKLLVKAKSWFRLLEDLGTEPRVYYIGQPPLIGSSRARVR